MAVMEARLPFSRLQLCFLFIICIVLPAGINGMYIEGHLETREEWAFLGRFCYLSERGRLKFEFEYPQKDFEPQNILLYFDSEDQWPAVYKTETSCHEKYLTAVGNNTNRIIRLAFPTGGCLTFDESGKIYISCQSARRFETSRARWWYFAASHCGTAKTCLEKESVLRRDNNQIINLTSSFVWSGCNPSNKTYTCLNGRSFRSSRSRWWYMAVSHCTNNTKNCWQKEATVHPENHQIIYLNIFSSSSGCKVFNVTGTPTYYCRESRRFAASRSRWWYIAVSKCGSAKNCNQKEAALNPMNNQIIYLNVYFPDSGCKVFNTTGKPTYYCKGYRRFQASRARWWYVATSKCGSTKNCDQKEAALNPENNQIIYLNVYFPGSGCKVFNTTGKPTYYCKGYRRFRASRARWWYVATSKCGSTKNCDQKEAALNPGNNQIIYLNVYFPDSGCKIFNTTGKPTYYCKSYRRFQASRARWWYVAVSKCGSTKTCQQKLDVLDTNNNQIIALSERLGCKVYQTEGKNTLTCSGGRRFRASRSRWWYIAASKCGSAKGLNLKYKMTMTNGDEDDFFFRHFSADEFYILQVDIAFLVVFLVIFVLSVICGSLLRSRQLFHTTYKLYMVALLCEVFYLLIMCVAYGKYAGDGRNTDGLKLFGRVFESASTLIFLLLLILMAKGYTITRGRLSTSGAIKLAVFMTFYTITYIVLFIYDAYFTDPGEVLYLYESPPGYGLIGLRLLGWIWFCYAIFFTLKHYPEKATFFYPFFIFYTIWFWASPIVTLIANFVIEKWIRAKVVNAINIVIDFIGLVFFLFLTRPTAANKNFPYHVRTSQIGVMNTVPPSANGGVPNTASTEMESFQRYAYAPAEPPPPYGAENRNFAELFTVSNTRSAKNNEDNESTTDNQDAKGGTLDQFPHQKNGNPFVVSG